MASGVLHAADRWFEDHGLPYFVPEHRAAARRALRPGRSLPLLVLAVAVVIGAVVAFFVAAGDLTFLPALGLSVVLLAGLWYALDALRAARMVRWAVVRTFGSLRELVSMSTRALPLLLIFVTFLFVNADVWQVSANLSVGALWLSALVFGGLAVLFLLVRLPEEVDRVDDDVTDELILEACTGTPLASAARELVDRDDADPAAYAEVSGYERWNLIVVLLVVQIVQVVLLSLCVFVLLMGLGALIMSPGAMTDWLGAGATHPVLGMTRVTRELVYVSVFLASFSALYLTVTTVTDESYRAEFFRSVMRELERAVGMRAVYRALRSLPEAAHPAR